MTKCRADRCSNREREVPALLTGPYLNGFLTREQIDVRPSGAVMTNGIQNKITVRANAPQMPQSQFGAPLFVSPTMLSANTTHHVTMQLEALDGGMTTVVTREIRANLGPAGGPGRPAYLAAQSAGALSAPLAGRQQACYAPSSLVCIPHYGVV